MIDVTILYCPDGSVSSSIAPLEVFYAAGTRWNLCVSAVPEPRFTITTVSVDGQPVLGGAGVRVIPDMPLSAIEHTDLVLIPAGGTDIDVMIEKNAAGNPLAARASRQGHAHCRRLHRRRHSRRGGSSRRTSRHHPLGGRRLLPEALSEGRLAAAALRDRGSRRALRRRRLCLDRSRALHRRKALWPRHRDGLREVAGGADAAHLSDEFCRAPFGRDHGDAAIRSGEDWLHNHFPDDIDLDQLAEDLALAPRTFLRRFKAATGETPLAYLQRLRTEAAKRMLEDDRMTIQEVGFAVGYEDVAFFRDLFKRHAGLPPGAYRDATADRSSHRRRRCLLREPSWALRQSLSATATLRPIRTGRREVGAECPQCGPQRRADNVGGHEPLPRHGDRACDEPVQLPQHHHEAGANNDDRPSPPEQLFQFRQSFGRQPDDPAIAFEQRPAAEMTDRIAGTVAEHGSHPHEEKNRNDRKVAACGQDRCADQGALSRQGRPERFQIDDGENRDEAIGAHVGSISETPSCTKPTALPQIARHSAPLRLPR